MLVFGSKDLQILKTCSDSLQFYSSQKPNSYTLKVRMVFWSLHVFLYRCEVSGEAPIFATDSKYGDMLVVVVPDQGPIIDGAKTR